MLALESRLKMECRSTFDSNKNSLRLNRLSHSLVSAKQEEKGDLWCLFLSLSLHPMQAKLMYASIHAVLK